MFQHSDVARVNAFFRQGDFTFSVQYNTYDDGVVGTESIIFIRFLYELRQCHTYVYWLSSLQDLSLIP